MQVTAFFPRRYLALSRPSRAHHPSRSVLVCARKGFGKQLEPLPTKKKIKAEKGKRQKEATGEQPAQGSREEQFNQKMERMAAGTVEEEMAFEERLKLLQGKAQNRQLELEKQKEREAVYDGPLSYPAPLQEKTQPPPAAKPTKNSTQDARPAGLGLGQLAIGIGSLALVAVFVITSGGSPAPDTSPPPAQERVATEDQLMSLQEQAAALEAKLKEDPSNAEALQSGSVVYAALGDTKKAAGLLERLTQAVPDNARFWQALADARIRLQDNRGAVAAFDKSIALSEGASLEQLQGLAGALLAEKKPQEALDRLEKLQPSSSGNGASEIEVQLLRGKIYSQWDRHFASALETYDGIVQKFPEDFRGYLARGALLQQNGRKGDAQRMFLQARFLAPPEARQIVDSVAKR